jgi:8-oxo-dGTP pyrophosphatase MutT (NUDIX family)
MPREKVSTQHGALPFALRGGELFVLLITTRESGRWLIPKGWPEKGLAPHEVAAHEAFEEAGMVGIVGQHPVGSFEYLKRMDAKTTKRCRVMVFPLQVEQELDEWPEKHERTREWVRPAVAAERINEPELAALILAFAKPPIAAAGRSRRA